MNIVYRRGFYEQIADILLAAREPIMKTPLTYRANLDFSRMEFFLPKLIRNGLLLHSGRYFQTSTRGLEYIRAWLRLKIFLKR